MGETNGRDNWEIQKKGDTKKGRYKKTALKGGVDSVRGGGRK